jgi:hypothetical protein
VATRVALTYTATIVVALAAHQAKRPDLIRSPKHVLAHLSRATLLGVVTLFVMFVKRGYATLPLEQIGDRGRSFQNERYWQKRSNRRLLAGGGFA